MIYSDFCRGFLRSVKMVNGLATERVDLGIGTPGNVPSFGVDSAGELYVLTYGGRVLRIIRN